MNKILYWTPRILMILFICFISIFAFDAFDGKSSIWKSILGFLIHLIPCYILILILILSWRREWIGGILFFALAVFYIIWAWGKFHWSAYVFISGPLFIIGVLFLLNWRARYKLKSRE